MADPREPSDLTDEQLRLVKLVARGWTDQRIAGELNLSVASVQRRLRAVSGALAVNSRVSLAMRAVGLGLVDVDDVSRDLKESEKPNQGDAN